MKKPTYTLSIPQPCHERWDAMTPSEKGRFCASCQKQVVDFSRLSDREVIQLIEQSSGKLCGRLRPQQIDRPMVVEPWVQRASVRFSGFFAGLMMLSSADAAFSQENLVPTEAVSTQIENGRSVETGESLPEKFTIEGRVTDVETGEPKAFATVVVMGTSRGASSDAEGFYLMRIPADEVKDMITLRVSSLGYDFIEFNVSKDELSQGIRKDFQLRRIEVYIDGIIHIDRKPKRKKR